MLKVTGSAMPGAVGLLSVTTVVAAAAAGDEERATKTSTRLNLDELSLYTAAPPPQQTLLSRYAAAEPEAGQLEQSVATVRTLVEPYASWCQGAYSSIKPKVQSLVQCGTDTYDYLKNPPKDFYPRAGVIGFSGVVGLLLAARGSRVKKLLYPTALMTVSASLYYPEKAAAIAKSTGDSVYDRAVQSYAALEKMVNPQSKRGEKKEEEGNDPEHKP